MRPSDRCGRPAPRKCGGRSIRVRSAAGVRTRRGCNHCSKSWKRVLHPQGHDGPISQLGVVVLLRAPILLHRWLGVAFCLLFAMWFASGIVMHFLPYPSFSPIDLARVKASPSHGIGNSARAADTAKRWADLSDLEFVCHDRAATTDLSAADEVSAKFAGVIASDYAIRRQ
jgi:hypothetical protein